MAPESKSKLKILLTYSGLIVTALTVVWGASAFVAGQKASTEDFKEFKVEMQKTLTAHEKEDDDFKKTVGSALVDLKISSAEQKQMLKDMKEDRKIEMEYHRQTLTEIRAKK